MTAMTDIDLLPLPEGESSSFGDYEVHDNETMIEYARANVARNTALLRAEIKALWAGVDSLRSRLEDTTRDKLNAEARAERLEEALREARDAIEDWAGYASEYFREKHDLAGDLAKIDALLGEQEKK